MRARKKPVEVEVWQVGGTLDEIPDWALNNDKTPARFVFEKGGEDTVHHVLIGTLEGTMVGNFGDWIVRGVAGELYAVKPDIFEATYELLPEPVHGQQTLNPIPFR